MDYQDLKRVVREQYPFPIAYAHKKTLGVLDDNVEKLKCLVETAEVTIQFLALLALAQVRQDLLNVPHASPLADPPPTPPERGIDLSRLREEITLTNPTFGKWNRLAREVMKAYGDARDQLIVPELFDLFWRWDSSGQKLRSQRLDNTVIGPLITLRNDFHHGRVPDSKVRGKVTEGLTWLHQLLEAIQFLAQYQLSFTQRIMLGQDPHRKPCYIHDLTLFNGCFSTFDRRRWQSEMHLEPGSVVFLHSREGRHLILNPFLIFTDQIKGVPDLCVLNTMVHKKAIYVSCQFSEELSTKDDKWADGPLHHEALSEFFDLLRSVPQTSSFAPGSAGVSPASDSLSDHCLPGSAGVSLASDSPPGRGRGGFPGSADILSATDAGETPALPGEESPLSTAEMFQQKYRVAEPVVQHTSPYKFLDYYNPEDHDIFFGRDREIRLLQQKFYNSRLLVLHGESGTGKTSLIRAGLIPRLDSESYIPVYVRVLKDPLREIKRELSHQLGLDDVHPGCPQVTGCNSPLEGGQGGVIPLAKFLSHITERISKTVVIVLDQFEEFFLRFPEDVRQQFAAELAACIDTPRLDVKFLIALRSDYFASLAAFESSIPQIFTHQLQLERLTEAQALEAVIKPPEQLGIQVDEAMVQIKLLPELSSEEGTIEPPLLQIVCDALYENAQSEGRQEIGMTDYEAIGDVRGCLGKYLDTKLRQSGAKQPIARAVLKALVTTEGTKRASFVEELLSRMQSTATKMRRTSESASHLPHLQFELTEEELQKDYLDKFVRDRLVRVEDVEGRARYELSHEYLVAHIEAWIEESEREITKVLELIDRAYETYQATNVLLEKSALQMIKPFEEQIVLPTDKQAFVDRSKTQVRKQRRGLWLKVAAALMFVALVIGSISGYQMSQQYQNALIQTAKARFLAHDELGALLSAVKARTGNWLWSLSDSEDSFLRDILFNVREKNRFLGHFQDVVFSPDGKLLASAGGRSMTLWSVAGSNKVLTLSGNFGWPGALAFSPNGAILALGENDGTIKLYDVSSDQEMMQLSRHTDAFSSVAFSPDGTMLASASGNIIKFWSIPAGQELATLQGHSDPIARLVFSPDGTMLAAGCTSLIGSPKLSNSTIKLWDVANRKEMMTLQGHTLSVSSLAFSPDGKLLASRSFDTVKLWSVANGKNIVTLQGSGFAFIPDGTGLLFFANGSESIQFWNAANGSVSAMPSLGCGSNNILLKIQFHPDGKLLALRCDNDIRIFSDTGEHLATFNETAFTFGLQFGPAGKMFAFDCNNQTEIQLWKVADLYHLHREDLLPRSCEWLQDYLHNPTIDLSAADRAVCDDVLKNDMD